MGAADLRPTSVEDHRTIELAGEAPAQAESAEVRRQLVRVYDERHQNWQPRDDLVEAAEATGDPELLLLAYAVMSGMHAWKDPTRSTAYARLALAVLSQYPGLELGGGPLLSQVLNRIAFAHFLHGDRLEYWTASVEMVLAACREAAGSGVESTHMVYWGALAELERGGTREAAQLLATLPRARRNLMAISQEARALALYEASVGRVDRAIEISQAPASVEVIGMQYARVMLRYLIDWLCSEGRVAEAETVLNHQYRAALGGSAELMMERVFQARIALVRGQLDQARREVAQIALAARSTELAALEERVVLLRAELALAAGRYELAERVLASMEPIRLSIVAHIRKLEVLSQLATRRDDYEAACGYRRQLFDLYQGQPRVDEGDLDRPIGTVSCLRAVETTLLEGLQRYWEQVGSVIGHDLRGLLTTCELGLSLMESVGSSRGRGAILASVRSISSLVETLATVTSLNVEEVDSDLEFQLSSTPINPTLWAVVDSLEPLAIRKGQTLITDLEATESASIFGDPGLLAIIITNLVENAIKYSPLGGTIEFRSALDPANRHGDRWLSIRVLDNGPGFDPSEADGLFGIGATGTASGSAGESSHGFGLYIVRELCRVLDANVVATGRDDGLGACFEVRLLSAHR